MTGATLKGVADGRVLKADESDHVLVLCAYSPNRLPLRGADGHVDLVAKRTLELASWRWMAKGARLGMFHKESGADAQVLESHIHRGRSVTFRGPHGPERVRDGDWIVALRLGDTAWRMYKAGKIGGLSMQGTCKRQPASADAIANLKE